ncbi:hypothetical protein FRC02_003733 [Tulasnella sp. 418]|nr:hypothetical protein FRC02_003733 [Tulasnella sp. 418]
MELAISMPAKCRRMATAILSSTTISYRHKGNDETWHKSDMISSFSGGLSSNTFQHRKHCLVATEGPFVGNYHPVRMTATNRRYLAFTLHFGSKNTFTPSHVCLPSHLPRLHKIFVLQGHGPASSFLFHQLRQISAQRVLVRCLIRAACGRLATLSTLSAKPCKERST